MIKKIILTALFVGTSIAGSAQNKIAAKDIFKIVDFIKFNFKFQSNIRISYQNLKNVKIRFYKGFEKMEPSKEFVLILRNNLFIQFAKNNSI